PSGAAYGAATADAADHAAGTGDLPDAAVDRPGSGAGLHAGRAGRHSADPAARGAGGDDPVGRHPGHAGRAPVVQDVWPSIQAIIQAACNLITGIINTAMAVIRGDWSAAWEGVK